MRIGPLLSILAWLAGVSYAADPPTIDQILERHNATIQRMQRCTVSTHETWLVTMADGSEEQLLSVRNCQIRLDGSKANLLVDEINYPRGITLANAGKQGHVNEFNYVRDDQVLQVFYPHEQFDVRPANPGTVSGRLAPQADDEFYVQGAIGNAATAFGMATFLTPIPISKLLSISKNTPPEVDNFGYRVEGISPNGTKHKIWFDPSSSYIARRIMFEQSGETSNENRFKHNRRLLTARYGFDEKDVVNSVVFLAHDVQVKAKGDTHVVTGLVTEKTVTAASGRKAVERTIHTLTDWDLNPDFSDPASFKPLLPVPEGAHVLVEDSASLEYSYQRGKIQLTVHEKTVESLKRVQLPLSPTQPRVQWVWGIVASLMGVIWWRLRAAST